MCSCTDFSSRLIYSTGWKMQKCNCAKADKLGVSLTSEEKLQAGSAGNANGIRTISADGKEGGEVLYMGIIDILQELRSYTNTKAMESRLKSFQYSLKKSFRRQSNVSDISTAVSSMPPSHYAKRFLDFMRQIFR
eukprot:s436_g3.t1